MSAAVGEQATVDDSGGRGPAWNAAASLVGARSPAAQAGAAALLIAVPFGPIAFTRGVLDANVPPTPVVDVVFGFMVFVAAPLFGLGVLRYVTPLNAVWAIGSGARWPLVESSKRTAHNAAAALLGQRSGVEQSAASSALGLAAAIVTAPINPAAAVLGFMFVASPLAILGVARSAYAAAVAHRRRWSA